MKIYIIDIPGQTPQIIENLPEGGRYSPETRVEACVLDDDTGDLIDSWPVSLIDGIPAEDGWGLGPSGKGGEKWKRNFGKS